MTDGPLRPILIILPDGFADWETPLIEAAAPEFCGVTVRHATPGGGSARSIGGLTVSDLPEIEIRNDEVIVLCGSDIWTGDNAPDLSDLLRQARDNGQPIAGICAATLALGRAGLLADVAHTSNSAAFVDYYLPGYAGRARYVDQPRALADGGIITAPGSAPVSFAAEVLRAAGVPEATLSQIVGMVSAEHSR